MIDETKFKKWLELKSLSENTVNQYVYYYDKINWNDISGDYWMDFIKQFNNSVSRAFLKNLMEYCEDNTGFYEEIFQGFKLPKQTGRKKKRLPKVLTLNEVYKIAKAMNTKRYKIMTLLSFYGGLRASELLNIKPYDFKWNSWKEDKEKMGHLNVIGKGNKERTVYIPKMIMEFVHSWIIEEISQKQGKEDRLFKISHRRWAMVLSKVSLKFLGKHVNPHMFRSSCCTYLIEQGMPIEKVSKILGHDDINTTMIYTHISQDSIQEEADKIFNEF